VNTCNEAKNSSESISLPSGPFNLPAPPDVKPDNAKEIFSKPDVDGGLIGGAALKADDFLAIVNGF
jgi:hypothetical protein